MRFYGLIVGLLAVWRITHLFAAEDGPGEILARLRRRAGAGFWGTLLDCFYCLSLWSALPVAWLLTRAIPAAHGGGTGGGGLDLTVLLWLALSAGAILIERLTGQLGGTAGGVEPSDHADP